MWADLGTSGADEVRFKKVGSGTGHFTLSFTYKQSSSSSVKYADVFDLYGNLLFARNGPNKELLLDNLSFRAGDTITNDIFIRKSSFYFCNLLYPVVLNVVKIYNGLYGCDIRIRNNKPTLYTISMSYNESQKRITCTYCKLFTFENDGSYTSEDFNISQIYC